VDRGHSSVTKGWSYIAGMRAETLKRLKEAAAKLWRRLRSRNCDGPVLPK
jgi:hypothetical protein